MNITKRFNRILQLFFILQSKSVVTVKELEKRFEIGKRTIYRDLQALEQAGVPISYETGKGYSIVEGFRIQPSRFTQEEVLSLTIAEKIMQQHETQFIKQHFEAALIKVKSSFQGRQKSILTNLEDKLHVNVGLNAEDYLPNVIDILLCSTVRKLVTSMYYLKSSETQAVMRQIEPVGLFYESNFWYVLAFCHLRQDYRNFRMDRIRKIFLTDQHFTREHLPVNQLRNNNLTEKITKISIKVDQKFAHYLFWERQEFGFTEEQMDENEVIMSFDCKVHPTAFVRWFMKFVDVGEITEPAFLQNELAEILKAGSVRITKLSKP